MTLTTRSLAPTLLALCVALTTAASPVLAADEAAGHAGRTPTTKVRLDTRDIDPGNGYARVDARIVWRSARTAVVRGYVDDVCPNNGQSAVVVLEAEFRGHDVRQWSKEDARDCTAGGLRFQKTFTADRRLRSVRITVAEKSGGRLVGRARTSWNKR